MLKRGFLADTNKGENDSSPSIVSKRGRCGTPGLRFARRYLTVGQRDNKSGFEGSPSSIVSQRGRCAPWIGKRIVPFGPARIISRTGRCAAWTGNLSSAPGDDTLLFLR